MKKTNFQKGFSLVETMVVTALSSVIVLGVFSIFQVGGEQTQLSQALMSLEDSVRESLYKMTQEIRQSAPDRITIGNGGNSISFDFPDPDNPIDASYNVNWAAAHTITYAIGGDGSQIIRTDTNTGLIAVLANDITGIQFTGDSTDPEIVTITLNAQRTLSSGRQIPQTPLEMTAQAEVRNT